jgi:hypothetical protein
LLLTTRHQDRTSLSSLGRIWPISAGMVPSRWLFNSIRPWSCTDGADQGSIGPTIPSEDRFMVVGFCQLIKL